MDNTIIASANELYSIYAEIVKHKQDTKVDITCQCESCGKIFSYHSNNHKSLKNVVKSTKKHDKLLCKACKISYTYSIKTASEKQNIKTKRESTNLKNSNGEYTTPLVGKKAKEAFKHIDWNARNIKSINTFKTNFEKLSDEEKAIIKEKRHLLGLENKKRLDLAVKNKYNVNSYIEIYNSEKSKLGFDRKQAIIDKYSIILNDRDTFKGRDVLKLECKKCNRIYLNTKTSSIKRCPKCYPEDWKEGSSSKGERELLKLLRSYGLVVITQKTFKDLKGNRGLLRFDAYLPDYNIAIEYQGSQHYYVKGPSKEDADKFELIKKYDSLKEEYCKKNNILLYKIPFYENIESNVNKIIEENGIIKN